MGQIEGGTLMGSYDTIIACLSGRACGLGMSQHLRNPTDPYGPLRYVVYMYSN